MSLLLILIELLDGYVIPMINQLWLVIDAK